MCFATCPLESYFELRKSWTCACPRRVPSALNDLKHGHISLHISSYFRPKKLFACSWLVSIYSNEVTDSGPNEVSAVKPKRPPFPSFLPSLCPLFFSRAASQRSPSLSISLPPCLPPPFFLSFLSFCLPRLQNEWIQLDISGVWPWLTVEKDAQRSGTLREVLRDRSHARTHAARNNEAESWPVNDNLGSSRTLLEVEGVININSCVCCGCGHANCSRWFVFHCIICSWTNSLEIPPPHPQRAAFELWSLNFSVAQRGVTGGLPTVVASPALRTIFLLLQCGFVFVCACFLVFESAFVRVHAKYGDSHRVRGLVSFASDS